VCVFVCVCVCLCVCVCVCVFVFEYKPQTEKCPLEEKIQSGVYYPFTNCPICILFDRDRQPLMTNDEGGKSRDLTPSA
jgi:hypothetical protein